MLKSSRASCRSIAPSPPDIAKQEYFKESKCLDVSEQKLKKLLAKPGSDKGDGEGGCPHAAAQGMCEKSSLVHKSCCESCTLHRDIEKEAKNPFTALAQAAAERKLKWPVSCGLHSLS